MPVPLKMRKDIVETKFSRDAILSNAPKVEDGFFVVPKVVG
jgi:aspartyl/glutamyl-tRNA(Asn/Gln) amidotransferase C subunit